MPASGMALVWRWSGAGLALGLVWGCSDVGVWGCATLAVVAAVEVREAVSPEGRSWSRFSRLLGWCLSDAGKHVTACGDPLSRIGTLLVLNSRTDC
jgi:hypothetical protein